MRVEDFKLIREIAQNGGRTTSGEFEQGHFEQLVKLGWLVPTEQDSVVVYVITERGRAAASYRQFSRLA